MANVYHGLVEGLIERDYHINKNVNDLTTGEKAMYEELAAKLNYAPSNPDDELGSQFYEFLKPIYKEMTL